MDSVGRVDAAADSIAVRAGGVIRQAGYGGDLVYAADFPIGKSRSAAPGKNSGDGRAVTCAAVTGAEGENGGNTGSGDSGTGSGDSGTGNSDSGTEGGSGGTDSGTSDDTGKLPDNDKDDIMDGLEDIKANWIRKIRSACPEADPEIKENLNKMKDELSSISGNMKNMQNTISDTGDSVSDAAGNISNELTDQSKLSGDTIDSLTDSIDGGIQSLTNSMKGLMNAQPSITDSMSSDLNLMGNDSLLDVSSGNITEKRRALIMAVPTVGSVEADINPGELPGTMNGSTISIRSWIGFIQADGCGSAFHHQRWELSIA